MGSQSHFEWPQLVITQYLIVKTFYVLTRGNSWYMLEDGAHDEKKVENDERKVGKDHYKQTFIQYKIHEALYGQ